MKKILIFSCFLCGMVSSHGDELILEKMLTPEGGFFEKKVLIYPAEISFGDTVYFCVVESSREWEHWEKLSDDQKKHTAEYLYCAEMEPRIQGELCRGTESLGRFNLFRKVSVTADHGPVFDCSDAEEREFWGVQAIGRYDNPKARVVAVFSREIPALDDFAQWASVFPWNSNRGEQNDFTLNLQIFVPGWYDTREVSVSLKIRPRRSEENRILAEWLQRANHVEQPKIGTQIGLLESLRIQHPEWGKETLEPIRQNVLYRPLTDFQPVKMTIRPPEEQFAPMTRLNSLAGVPVMPLNAREWKELEDRFEPSTLRDEIQFLRMVSEVFESSREDETSLNALLEWLRERPLPQRISMTARYLEMRPQLALHRIENEISYHRKKIQALERCRSQWHARGNRFPDQLYKEMEKILKESQNVP